MSLHRTLVYALLTLVVSGASLIILNIWGIEIDPKFFFKVLATIGVLIVLIGLVIVIKSDFGEHKRLKDDGFID